MKGFSQNAMKTIPTEYGWNFLLHNKPLDTTSWPVGMVCMDERACFKNLYISECIFLYFFLEKAFLNPNIRNEAILLTTLKLLKQSMRKTNYYSAFRFRLKVDNNGGAWCPKHMVSRGLNEYLQIDLLQVHMITAVRTQGRFGKGQGQEYTEAYAVNYWRPGFDKWIQWKNSHGNKVWFEDETQSL